MPRRRLCPKPQACPTCTRVGTCVRTCRELRGLTRAQLGEKAGLSVRQVRSLELNETCVYMDCLLPIMAVLRVPVEAIFPPEDN